MSAWSSALQGAIEGAAPIVAFTVLGLASILGAARGARADPDASESLRGCVPPAVPVGGPDAPAVDAVVAAELHQLAKGLSHDFSGPLRSVSAALSIVEDDLQAGDVEAAHETVAVVRRQTEQLARMAGALVRYCRSAWQPCGVEPLRASDAIAGILAELEVGPALQVDVQVPPQWVRLEADAMRTVLEVVLTNAVNHRPHAGIGIIRVLGRVEEGRGVPDWLVLEVHDDGIGVPVEMHESVFGVFRRSTTPAVGSGLGLTLAATLTQRFGGQIALVDSDLGGCCVHLRWPLHPVAGGMQ